MKKRYEKPQMEVVQIGESLFLCYSGGLGAPEFFDHYERDWVEKAYQFGGWDIKLE